jgi:hypothetical protein
MSNFFEYPVITGIQLTVTKLDKFLNIVQYTYKMLSTSTVLLPSSFSTIYSLKYHADFIN